MTFKEKLRLNKKRALSGLFILFFLSSSLIAITPRRAYAAPVPLSPTEKAAAYQAASVLAECSKTQGYRNKEITSSVLNNGLVFNNQLRDWAASVGFLTPGMANSDGLFGCSNGPQVSSALQQLGQKGVDYFVDAGIYIPKAGGDGYTLKSNVEDPDRAKSIEAYFNKKFGFSLNSKLPPASQYFNLKATFDKKCSAGVVTSGTAGREVKIVDGKGAVTTKRYELNRLDVSHRVGFGMDKDGSNDGKMQCDTIVDQMNAFAGVAAIAQKAAVDAGANAATSGSSTSGTDADPADDTSCENRGGVSSWFACPLITLVAESLQWVDEQIQTLMVVNPNYYQTGQGAENLYKAWTAFRNIALALLIAAMMVIVISTALGVGVLDAYTVKKAFPRLIASVIFILLSWWLCVFMIDFFNVIGQGILGVMTSPFGLSGDKTILSLFDTSAGQAAGQGLIALIAGAGLFLVTGAIGILISWIGTALLVMLIAFLVLVARQMFIITLILFAPLAILAWIFPSTSKIWKFWWESFTKVLIMYPMVMALIGAGRIFASVINDQQATPSGEGVTGGSLLLPMAKLAAYVIPYAFIPFTFKAAGGLFGNLAGMANDRSRGGFDRLRKRRQQGYAQVGRNAKSGDLLRGGQGDKGVIGRLNAGVARASTGPQGRFGFGERGAKARAINRATFGAEAAKDPRFGQFLVNDGDAATVMALSGGTNNGAKGAVNDLVDGHMADFMRDNPAATQQDIKNKREELQSRFSRAYQGAAAMGINRSNATAALSNMGANKGYGLATGDLESLNQGIKRMGGGNSEQEALMGTAQYSLRGAGRLDVGGGLGDRSAPIDERDVLMDSIKKTGFNAEVANSPAATKQIARVATADAARASTMGTDDRRDTAVMAAELVDGLQYGATGEARDNTLAMVTSLGINPDQSPDVIKEQLMQCYGFTTGYKDPAGNPIPPPSGRAYIGPLQDITLGNRQRTANRAAGGPPPPVTSDLRLKKDIVYLGLTYSGIKIYKFKYLWSDVEYVGVMAQEVIHIHPDAVITDKWGYYKVDYAMLELKFMTHEEWQRNLINKVKENTV